MIIYEWLQLEEIRENVLRLTSSETKRDRKNITKTTKQCKWEMTIMGRKNDESITALLEKYNYSTVFLEKKGF